MSNFIHYRNFTTNHVARSIIVTPSRVRPTWMNTEHFENSQWPTPAMRTYEAVVSIPFIRFYFDQDSDKRQVLLDAVSRELYHEGGGRIYKRFSSNGEILIKQNLDEFKVIINKRLINHRHDTLQEAARIDFNSILSSFSEGERVMVSSRSTVMYEGVFKFDSVINTNYCYIQFDSRPHVIRWEKSLVHKIDISDSSNRRVTRGMARRQRTEESKQSEKTNVTEENASEDMRYGRHTFVRGRNRRVIILSDISDDSSDTESDNESQNQGGMGVARAPNHHIFESSSDEESDSALDRNQITDADIPEGTSYETLYALLGDGSENKKGFDDKWLTKQGFTSNTLKDEVCYLCHDVISLNELVYNIQCDGIMRHPIHTKCAIRYIKEKYTTCGICKFEWEP